MLRLEQTGYRLCDRVTRRDLLHVGGLGMLGLSLPNFLHARAASGGRGSFGKAKSCILFYLVGGPPQQETWDPKPLAPAEIRGDFGVIPSSIPGLYVGELMPKVARLAHKCCVFRAVATNDNAHSSSGYWVLTGVPYPRTNTECNAPSPTDWPTLGAVVKRLRAGQGVLPQAIVLPEQMITNANIIAVGQNAGFLGRVADPWLLTCDPSAPTFQVPELSLPVEVPSLRLDERRSLLQQVNTHLDAIEHGGFLERYDSHYHQAFDLLRSTRARRAFDLDAEPARVRDRYGRHKIGQATLLARRLVEAGVSLVQVNWPRERGDMGADNPCWDTHSKNTERLRDALMPPMDQTFSALLEDLDQRGLLDETLVIWIGEFGRTPRINARGGRDHWGFVFSAAMAGGGIRPGQVLGSSDNIAAYPRDGMVQPQDLTATIYHCLGYRPDTEIRDPQGRPLFISRGDVIQAALI